MIPLSPRRRSELRGEAHKLSPIVIIGDKGLTDEVVAEIDRSLKAHELIKVRANGEREARDAWLAAICERLGAHPVQQIGKVFVIYREKPEEAPEPTAQNADEGRRRSRGGVTERGRQAQRARDAEKQRQKDIVDMKRKGKIPANAATGSARPRSRTPSPLPESGPRRRRPRTSR